MSPQFICRACFASDPWVDAVVPGDGKSGQCSFAHNGEMTTVWDTELWTEIVASMADLYEARPGNQLGSLAVQLQLDWQIFAPESEPFFQSFLVATLGADHPLLLEQSVDLKTSASGRHVDDWEAFALEIREQNRFFPKRAPDNEALESSLRQTGTLLARGTVLYRARIHRSAQPFTAGDMGAPPRELASSGRANPPGIRYLYLAFREKTAVHEVRPSLVSSVAVAHFEVLRDLRVATVSSTFAARWFDVDDPSDLAVQLDRAWVARYLKRLSRELSKPVRAGDESVHYVPAQYLCEFAKSHGFDAVAYESATHSGGRNIVLFEPDSAKCVDIRYARIESLNVEYQFGE